MTNEEKFVKEIIEYIFTYPDDDYMTMECLCRKLVKYGLIDKKDGYYLVANGIKADRKTEPTISKMEQVDKDINVRSKDEPQRKRYYAICDDGCNWAVGSPQCEGCEILPKTEWYAIYGKTEPQTYISASECIPIEYIKDQIEEYRKFDHLGMYAEFLDMFIQDYKDNAMANYEDEPQTDCEGCIYENGESMMACVSCRGKVPYDGFTWDESQTKRSEE